MIIAGVDYSYTSPAICVWDTETDYKFENLYFYNLFGVKKYTGVFGNICIDLLPKSSTFLNTEEKFRYVCKWASDILYSHGVTKISIEGYSMRSKYGLLFQIAENTSLLKQWMRLNNVDFVTPAPTQIKKLYSGKGNAKKDLMVKSFDAKFPGYELYKILGMSEFDKKPIDDIVDSHAMLTFLEEVPDVV